MKMTLYTATCTGQETNCYYPEERVIESPEDLMAAVRMDHVGAAYKDHYRSGQNFLWSDVVILDIDNDGSDDSAEWMTEERLKETFAGISFAAVPSRNHMKEKNGRAARPKYHVLFPIRRTEDKAAYEGLKKDIHRLFPFFDGNALDAARFLYGSEAASVIWQEGETTIDAFVAFQKERPAIPEGQRNTTLSHFAGKIIKRFGATERAHEAFLEEAAKCDPPLPDAELATIWQSACRFGAKVAKEPGYVPPEEYEAAHALVPDDFSDVGEADTLAREYGGVLRYTDGTDFIRYTGAYWEESRQAGMAVHLELLKRQLADARKRVRDTMQALLAAGADGAKVQRGGKTAESALSDDNQRKLYNEHAMAQAYLAFIMKQRGTNHLTAVLRAVRPMVGMKISELDSHAFLLNTPSGTFDLRKGMEGFKEHDPSDFITKCTAVDPGDEGVELWQDALQSFFCSDQALIAYAQRIAGLAVIGKVYVEALIIAYGGGRNGKSTYWNAQAKVLGSYAGTISADALTSRCPRNVKPEMAELKGKRMVIAAETEEGMRLSTSVLKQLASTDPVSAEKKYKDPFHFEPTHTLILFTNHLPRVGAMDDGTWRRLIVIPFHATFQGASDIKNYGDYLVRHAGPAILKWMIEGARLVIAEKFNLVQPEVVQEAIGAYREENNWFEHFVDDCCETGEGLKEHSGELLARYRSYCLQTGEYPRSTTDFYAAIERAGFVRCRRRDGRYVLGIQLKPSDFGA